MKHFVHILELCFILRFHEGFNWETFRKKLIYYNVNIHNNSDKSDKHSFMIDTQSTEPARTQAEHCLLKIKLIGIYFTHVQHPKP